MPRLSHNHDGDLFHPALQKLVPAGGHVDISDDEAAKVNVETGVWKLSTDNGGEFKQKAGIPDVIDTAKLDHEENPEMAESEDNDNTNKPSGDAPATRSTSKQGAEVNNAPAKETR